MNQQGLPRGVITASLTPFNKDLSPDHTLLLEHCNGILNKGGNGILLLGTTGEANSMSVEERQLTLERLLKGGLDPKCLLVGTGTSSLTETVSLTRHAIDSGVRDVLVMPPFYYRKVTEDGLFEYFKELFNRVPDEVRLYLYHFPAMSGIDVSIDLMDRLISAFPGRFIGMKDSGGNLGHMLEILKRFPEFRLYSGTERLLTATLDHGSQGCISATTNYSLTAAVKVYQAYLRGDDHSGYEERMLAFRTAFEGHVFAPAVKAVLHEITGQSNWRHVRPPLSLPSDEVLGTLLARLRDIT